MSDLRSIVADYWFKPEIFWPEDSYFHRRNRDKILSARKAFRLENPADFETTILPVLRKRAEAGLPSLFVISAGASGCHFLGSIISSRSEYRMIGEIYFPSALVEFALGLDQETDRHILLDMVSAVPAALGEARPEIVPVNVMHLRPDSPISQLRENVRGSRFVGLIRNPFDVAVSRTFRKSAYRQTTNPDRSDSEYAGMQARNVRRFFSMFDKQEWDAIVRYEELIASPIPTAKDLLSELDLPSHGLNTEAFAMDNHNREPRPEIDPTIANIFREELSDCAALQHYDPPDNLMQADLAMARHWAPMESELSAETALREVRTQGRLKVTPSLPSFTLDEVDFERFDEKFLHARTWKMYFWTLGWLYLIPELPDGADVQVDWLGNSIDWTATWCNDQKAAPANFWDDHATAYRLATLIHLTRRLGGREGASARRDKMRVIVPAHLAKLREFMRSPRWKSSNHGVFHALSAINAALHSEFGETAETPARQIVAEGLQHLDAVLRAILDPETGISREQSLHYHVWALGLLSGVERFLAQNKLEIGFPIVDCYEKMLSFASYLMVGNEPMPAIGDTGYRAGYSLPFVRRRATEMNFPNIRSPQNFGIGEHLGQLSALVGPDRGFTVMRRHESCGGERDSLIVFNHHPERISHGHHDALSVWLTHRGSPQLIDSGGPYAYGQPLRYGYFMSSFGHNCVIIDGAPFTSGARLLREGGSSVLRVAHARIEHCSGVVHDRIVQLDKAHRTLIRDRLVCTDGKDHEFLTLFHLAPELDWEFEASGGGRAKLSCANGVRLLFATSAPNTTLGLVEGEEHTTIQGWVTPRQGHKDPAPVLFARNRGQTLTSITLMGDANANASDAFERAVSHAFETGDGPDLFDESKPISDLLQQLQKLQAN